MIKEKIKKGWGEFIQDCEFARKEDIDEIISLGRRTCKFWVVFCENFKIIELITKNEYVFKTHIKKKYLKNFGISNKKIKELDADYFDTDEIINNYFGSELTIYELTGNIWYC